MGLQSCKSPNFGNFGTPNLGVSGQNDIRKYYKEEGGGIPPSSGHGESCEFVFARGLFVHQKCSNYTLTNLFGLCRSV
jgi:hypothetical protein